MSRSIVVAPCALLLGCSANHTTTESAAIAVASTTYLHPGFGAGPLVFTDASGHLLEERRYEPFGTPIGAPDLAARDLNALNKRTDAATGWSDHGARWLAPETARWLAPDPVVAGPDVRFMDTPWGLHPYQYVDQNPTRYWDPDGRQPQITEQQVAREILRINDVLDRDRGSDPREARWILSSIGIAFDGWSVVVSGHDKRSGRGSYDALVTYDRSAANTIDTVLRMAGDTPLRRLMIADHGFPASQTLGSEVLFDVDSKGKPEVDPALLRLAGKFTRDGVLVLGGCNIMDGDDAARARAFGVLRYLSKTLQVEVRAGTGKKSVGDDEIRWETTACRGDRCVTANDERGLDEAWKK